MEEQLSWAWGQATLSSEHTTEARQRVQAGGHLGKAPLALGVEGVEGDRLAEGRPVRPQPRSSW